MTAPLERARQVVAAFVPQDKPGNHYVYAYLGKASYDATQYEIIDGLALASSRIWHLDETQTDCCAYIGLGVRERLNLVRKHPFVPSLKELRIKLIDKLSHKDAKLLEGKLIQELGCLLDTNRSDGCLANTKLSQSGCDCAADLRMEAARYKSMLTRMKKRGCFIAFTSDKTIVASGYIHQLAQQLKVSYQTLNRVLRNERVTFISPLHKQALYICDEDSYDSFKCKITNIPSLISQRTIHVQHLWGGEIFVGTAAELAAKLCLPESEALHRIAQRRNGALQVNGYIAAYDKDPAITKEERYQLNQRITICCNQAKKILFVGSRSEAAIRFQISKRQIDDRMQNQKDTPAYSPCDKEYIYFVSHLRFPDFIPKAVSPTALSTKRTLKVTSLDGSQSFTGTTRELKPLLGIDRVDGLHISARSGGLRATRGWRAVYLD